MVIVPVTVPVTLSKGDPKYDIHALGKELPPAPTTSIAVVSGTSGRGDFADPERVADVILGLWESTPPTNANNIVPLPTGASTTCSHEIWFSVDRS
jgi:hypothetical protein